MTRRFIAALLAAVMLTACAAGPTHTAHVAIVSLGGAVRALHDENARVYRAQTDALIAELADAGAHADAYAARSAALTTAFRARSDALVALDAAVYAAAAINDAVRAGAPTSALLSAAAELVATIDTELHVLRDGRVLPALNIPSEVLQVAAVLRALLPTPVPTGDAAHAD